MSAVAVNVTLLHKLTLIQVFKKAEYIFDEGFELSCMHQD